MENKDRGGKGIKTAALGQTCGGGKGRVVVGVEARIEVDVQGRVEVGLRVAAAEDCGGVGRAGRGAGDRRAPGVRVRR